ncbi:flagellar motility protein MotE (MotC chaperone) [Aliiruegeria haliotis]|uniref:Flagellar motility protein MotE (MotC chaperone) n=1 Tax=Aliiruegeria haliotis TaxID=1280846 RepID=A0A2T0RPZ6_9RHOB|nr:hypothetical protein [Aliiruegeria haliotis]PRY23207.1 flagellar motility protein MotE (MotC chaperone) [Aliiruegeria haliotis]
MRAKKNLNRVPRRRILVLVAILLASSGGLRTLNGASAAFALQIDLINEKVEGDKRDPHCNNEEDISRVLDVLQRRQEELDVREGSVEYRAKTLEVIEREIEINLSALAEAEDSLVSVLALADGAAERDVERLTRVYERMKPEQASLIFEAMDPVFSSGFLARMRPEAAAPIMAQLSPNAAYALSAYLVGRNLNVPKD